jgi:Fis family transcriptional regulator
MTIHFQSTDAMVMATTDQMADGEENAPLSGHIKSMLEGYFNDLDGHAPADLYQMVLQEIEQPLLESVLHYTRGNQSKAAIVLGLNRGTLRKKLKQYDLN